MYTDFSRIAVYRMFVEHEFGNYERLLQSMEESIRSAEENFWSAVHQDAQNIMDAEERNDFLTLHVDVGNEIENLLPLSMNAVFLASVSWFEHRLLLLCDQVQRSHQDPDGVRDLRRSTLRNAKDYLRRHQVEGPFETSEWQDATRYYEIRNSIAHQGSSLIPQGDTADYAKRKGIVLRQSPILNIVNPNPQTPLALRLTKPFCQEAIETLKLLLYGLFDAVETTAGRSMVRDQAYHIS